MSLESVARLAELAATDSGVLSALQNDPSQIRKPLQLSDAQMHALISASSFTTDRPVRTTSQPEAAIGNTADLMELGTLGTLLPPEGSGAFPTPAELPPVPVAPKNVAPVPVSPSPRTAPQTPPQPPAVPAAPRHSGPTPGSPSLAPLAPSPQSSTPQSSTPRGTPSVPRSPVTPGSSSQTPGTPASIVVPGSPQAPAATSSGTLQSTSQPQVYAVTPTQFAQAPGLRTPLRPGGCCGCEVGMVALTAQLSATAEAAITAITAIAGLE